MCPYCRKRIKIWFVSDKLHHSSSEKKNAIDLRSAEVFTLFMDQNVAVTVFDRRIQIESLLELYKKRINCCTNGSSIILNSNEIFLEKIKQCKIKQDMCLKLFESFKSKMWYFLSAPVEADQNENVDILTKEQQKIIIELKKLEDMLTEIIPQ